MVTDEQVFNFLKEKGLHAPILTDSLQRKFRLGYAEAANLMDRLVEEGYVSEYYPKKRVRFVLKTN